jgi:hypothetical protein
MWRIGFDGVWDVWGLYSRLLLAVTLAVSSQIDTWQIESVPMPYLVVLVR